MGINGSYVMRTLPPAGWNINCKRDGKSSELACVERVSRETVCYEVIRLVSARHHRLVRNHILLTQVRLR